MTDYETMERQLAALSKTDRRVSFWLAVASLIVWAWFSVALLFSFE